MIWTIDGDENSWSSWAEARAAAPASSVALVVAICALFHLGLTELIGALQEIHRVLIPGGKAVLYFIDPSRRSWVRLSPLLNAICPEQGERNGMQGKRLNNLL